MTVATSAIPFNLEKSLDSIHEHLGSAAEIHSRVIYLDAASPERAFWEPEISDHVENAFDSTLVLLELLGLHRSYEEVLKLRESARTSQGGFGKEEIGEEEPYLYWRYRLWRYLRQISDLYVKPEKIQKESYELESILQACEYAIVDSKVYQLPPQNEDDVHSRIENILKCYYQDLKTKPTISKQVKNYIPDTGLPSLKTLLEYKYITTLQEARVIADQILADSRAYHSSEWKKIIFVLYETTRIKKESEWNQLFESCGIADQKIIVLHGTPAPKKKHGHAPPA